MINLSNTQFVKLVLLLTTACCILVFIFGLANNAGLRRFINVERTQEHGVVIINNVKYPTPYRTDKARIGYTVANPLEYLLIPSGSYQQSVLSAALNLFMFVLFGLFVWQFDFDDPFQPKFLIRAYRIYRLFVGSYFLAWACGKYTGYWSKCFFFKSDYRAVPGNAAQEYTIFLVLFSIGIHLYTRAVKNKQELDLTI